MISPADKHLKRVGILGGTFDPIHKGHLLLATEAKKQFDLDRVFLIPTYQTPIKNSQRMLTPAEVRLEMIKYALSEIECCEVLDWEITRQGISYSIDTVKTVKEFFPGGELFFLMGSDSFLSLPQWKQPEEIAKLVTFLVAVRGQHEKQVSESPFYSKTKRLKMPLYPVSSSLVRQRIAEGKNVEDVLTSPVLKYIRERELYSS